MSRQFHDVLRELDGGGTHGQLTEELNELVDAVVNARKPGEITLKIRVKPNGENSVKLETDIKVKVPQLPHGESIFFVGEGGLFREDPRQKKLPLRSIGDDEAEARSVGDDDANRPLKEVGSK